MKIRQLGSEYWEKFEDRNFLSQFGRYGSKIYMDSCPSQSDFGWRFQACHWDWVVNSVCWVSLIFLVVCVIVAPPSIVGVWLMAAWL